MALRILDWFGFDSRYSSDEAEHYRTEKLCPFIKGPCTKLFSDRTVSGVCTVSMIKDPTPVVICPNRLYAGGYALLHDVISTAFGADLQLFTPEGHSGAVTDAETVVGFGKNFGKELRLPARQAGSGYFVDWVLAKINASGELDEFVAVEVQSLDTTGTYRPQVKTLRQGARQVLTARAGLNWENVNKRILPQLIYKGHVLRRESLCRKGLFFVTPTPVHDRIMARLGRELLEYGRQPGSMTFMWYSLGPPADGIRPLELVGTFSTTVDQVAHAFTSPVDLPDAGVYEKAIREALS